MRLVKDTDGSGKIDGLSHILPGGAAGLIAMMFFIEGGVSLWWGFGGLAIVAILMELSQERKVAKKSSFSWKDRLPHRVQDVLGYLIGYALVAWGGLWLSGIVCPWIKALCLA